MVFERQKEGVLILKLGIYKPQKSKATVYTIFGPHCCDAVLRWNLVDAHPYDVQLTEVGNFQFLQRIAFLQALRKADVLALHVELVFPQSFARRFDGEALGSNIVQGLVSDIRHRMGLQMS